MIWPFRKKPAAAPEQWPPINEAWRSGDLAQCICSRWYAPDSPPPRQGQVVIVRSVLAGHMKEDGSPAWGLILEGFHSVWAAECFRKLRPCGDALDRRAAKTRQKLRVRA